MIKPFKNNNSGFTLIEVMATVSLLLIFTGAFLILLTQSYIAISNSGNKSSTIYDTQKEVEKIHSQKSVDVPYDVVINYSGGSKSIKGGLTTVENTEGTQHSTAQTFIPLAPILELYIVDITSEKTPAVFNDNNFNSTTVKISCVNFSYLNDNCSAKITNVNGDDINFYNISPDINNENLLNLSFNSKPALGTYTVFIKNFEGSFEAKGVFTVTLEVLPTPN